jgi:uncharacterized protein YegL
MTEPSAPPPGDEALNRWLATRREGLIESLAAALDIEAGLREVAIQAHHGDLIRDLEHRLDVEAGLGAILSLPVISADAEAASTTRESAAPRLPSSETRGSAREVRGVVLPTYLLVDESGSMGPYRRELADGLASMIMGLRNEPMIAAKVRLAVLGFSDDVQVRLAIADMRSETTVPQVSIRGATNYGEVFNDLRHRIPADVQWLRGQGYKVYRPLVFFLSDGQPTDGDGWRSSYATLVDKAQTPAAPNIIACGIGDASPQTMVEVATSPNFAFVARPGVDIGQAISGFFGSLAESMVASGQALDSANPQLVVSRPDQFIMAIDVI